MAIQNIILYSFFLYGYLRNHLPSYNHCLMNNCIVLLQLYMNCLKVQNSFLHRCSLKHFVLDLFLYNIQLQMNNNQSNSLVSVLLHLYIQFLMEDFLWHLYMLLIHCMYLLSLFSGNLLNSLSMFANTDFDNQILMEYLCMFHMHYMTDRILNHRQYSLSLQVCRCVHMFRCYKYL